MEPSGRSYDSPRPSFGTRKFLHGVSSSVWRKVFIGAVAMMNNGTVLDRAGIAMVAMVAQAYHIRVMVCCETYKFCDRAQLDSICYNDERKKDLTWRINWPT